MPQASPILACSQAGYNITEGGTYTTPGYQEDGSGRYPHAMDCQWRVVAPADTVKITKINYLVVGGSFHVVASTYLCNVINIGVLLQVTPTWILL